MHAVERVRAQVKRSVAWHQDYMHIVYIACDRKAIATTTMSVQPPIHSAYTQGQAENGSSCTTITGGRSARVRNTLKQFPTSRRIPDSVIKTQGDTVFQSF